MTRSYVLPVSALSLLTTVAGCGPDPILGTWDGLRITSDDGVIDLPYVYAYTQYGVDYTYTQDLDLTITETTSTLTYTYTYSVDGLGDVVAYDYTGTTEITDKGQATLVIPEYFDLPITCVADGDSLACTSDGATIDFVRREE